MSRISWRYSAANVAGRRERGVIREPRDNAESSPDGTAELGLSKGRAWTPRCTALLIVVLAGLSAVMVHRIHVGEFGYNAGETQHAVTGLFAADLMRDRH